MEIGTARISEYKPQLISAADTQMHDDFLTSTLRKMAERAFWLGCFPATFLAFALSVNSVEWHMWALGIAVTCLVIWGMLRSRREAQRLIKIDPTSPDSLWLRDRLGVTTAIFVGAGAATGLAVTLIGAEIGRQWSAVRDMLPGGIALHHYSAVTAVVFVVVVFALVKVVARYWAMQSVAARRRRERAA